MQKSSRKSKSSSSKSWKLSRTTISFFRDLGQFDAFVGVFFLHFSRDFDRLVMIFLSFSASSSSIFAIFLILFRYLHVASHD